MTHGTERTKDPGAPRWLAGILAFAGCAPSESEGRESKLPPDATGQAPMDAPAVPGGTDSSGGETHGERVARLEALLAAECARAAELEQRLAGLSGELAVSEERRIEREREWLEYQSLLAKISPARLPGGKPFAADLPGVAAPPALPAPSEAAPPENLDPAAAARSSSIAKSIRTLFTLEDVRGLDLLECGRLQGDAIGPVVFRLLDGRGRLAGSLYAERLRMEASRSGRTLTLVLEDGYEARGGERLDFAEPSVEGARGAVRRIVLDGVDPSSWADDFRELFGEQGLDLSGDDGLWDLAVVKQALNERLEVDRAGGTYRLRELGGVQDGVLLAVHLERLDADGAVERRLFADRLTLTRATPGAAGATAATGTGGPVGIQLLLEHGVQVRGEDERVPFLDGRYRILLPAADAQAWTRAGLPGLAPPPATRPRQD